jgi:hypothetical protein
MPTFAFGQSFRGKLRVEPTELVLDASSLIPELVVPLHIQLDHMAQSSLDHCLLLDIFAALAGGPRAAKLAMAERQPTPATLHQGNENQFNLRFPLDQRAAAELEHDRKGDIRLSFTIRPTLAKCERLTVTTEGRSQAQDFITGRAASRLMEKKRKA